MRHPEVKKNDCECTISGVPISGVETVSDRQPPSEKCSSGCGSNDGKKVNRKQLLEFLCWFSK